MSESVHTSTTELLDPENVDAAFGISLIFCIEAEILRCFISTSSFRRPSLICDSRRHCTVFASVPLYSSTTKMPVWLWISRWYLSWDQSFTYVLPVYDGYLDFKFGYSHQLYIIEAQFGRPTVQWKPHPQIPTRSKDRRGLRKPPLGN